MKQYMCNVSLQRHKLFIHNNHKVFESLNYNCEIIQIANSIFLGITREGIVIKLVLRFTNNNVEKCT